jgi:hypothetical protein
MPFSPNQYKSYLGHRLKGAVRVLKSHSRDRFIDHYKKLNVPLDSVLKLDGSPEYCHLCGYTNARLVLNSDWVLTTCSAFMLPVIVQNPALAQWATHLEKLSTPNSAQPAMAGQQAGQLNGE